MGAGGDDRAMVIASVHGWRIAQSPARFDRFWTLPPACVNNPSMRSVKPLSRLPWKRLAWATGLAGGLFIAALVGLDGYIFRRGPELAAWFHGLPAAVQVLVRSGLWVFYLGYGLLVLRALWQRSWERPGDRSLWAGAAYLTAQLLFSFLVVRVLKIGLGVPRPDAPLTDWQPMTLDNDYNSFPSGHSADAFAGYGVIDRLASSTWLKAVALVAAAIIALGRVAQFQHHLTDVIAGAWIGYLGAQAAVTMWAGRLGGGEKEDKATPLRPPEP